MAALKSLFALSLFAISATAVGTLLPEGWSVLDQCAVDVPSRIFKSVKIKNLSNNTPQDCVYYCDSQGYSYAGVEYGSECHCGRGYDSAAASAPASECNMPCTGDSSQKCGAGWRIQVFVTNDKLPASPALPDGWSTAYGCAVDSGDRVLLHNKMFTLPKSNTPAACVKKCASIGATHAGVEYGSECHCGVGYLWQPVSAPIEQCDMDCTGNSYFNCGSGYRISIYTLDAPSSATTTASSTTSSAASVPTTSSVAVSGNIGVYNKTSNQLIGYIASVNGGKTYKVEADQDKALNVQFKFSTRPNTPFSIRVTDDSPYGYFGAVQPQNYANQCAWCGEHYDEVVNVAYSKPGKALYVGNGYDDLVGGQRASQATMWVVDPRTKIIQGIWTNPSVDAAWPLNNYLYAPGMGTYMNTDLEAWKQSMHPAQGDVPVVYKLESPFPRYTPVCSGVSGWEYKTTDGSSFDIYCQVDHGGNDIAVTTQTSFATCMQSCATYNTQRGSGAKCVGVTWVPETGACWWKHTFVREAWVRPTSGGCDSAGLL